MVEKEIIRRNLENVRARIALAAERAGRNPATVRLIAVTKSHPAESIAVLIELGVTDIGESYAEEAHAKQLELGETASITWHMIGHVQSRKAQIVAENFGLVHSLDSLKLARRLDSFAGKAGAKLSVLLECNVSSEASKSGWPVWTIEGKHSFMNEVPELVKLPYLQIRGLMSIAPAVRRPDEARPFFAATRLLRDQLAEQHQSMDWKELSMGMSDDFEAAIAEGATLVRLGTAILGPRK